jgi:hypothetical protein
MKVRPEKLLTEIKIRASGDLPSFWWMQIACWSAYCLVLYLTILPFVTEEGGHLNVLLLKVYRSIFGFLLSSFLRLFYQRIYDRGTSQGLPLRSVFAALIGSLVFGCVWGAAEKLYWWMSKTDFDYSHAIASYPRVAMGYAIVLFAWSALYFGIKYWSNLRTQEEQLLRAQLEMLRYQINPHFLFNALNSIRASVNEDGNQARRMITQLSDFLRHSLVAVENKEISLREELEAARNYLAIEKIRFEENLEIEYEVEEKAEEFLVPCFLLNPLIENAVKHGLRASPKPLKIKISARLEGKSLILEVANTGSLNNSPNLTGTKIGLKNVRERLEKLYGEKGGFELKQDGEFVVAKIEISKAEM